MYLVLKSRRKRGLREMSKTEAELSDNDEDTESKDNQSVSDTSSMIHEEENSES
jgi:hypothetical protein